MGREGDGQGGKTEGKEKERLGGKGRGWELNDPHFRNVVAPPDDQCNILCSRVNILCTGACRHDHFGQVTWVGAYRNSFLLFFICPIL